MTEVADFYSVLGVLPGTDTAAIRAAYRSLARRFHPDVGGSIERMALINEAWSVLRNPASRLEYDQRTGLRSHRDTLSEDGLSVGPVRRAEHGPIQRRAERARGGAGRTVLDFGRFAGWQLADIARQDREYLRWLATVPIGRRYRTEIEETLNRTA